MLLRARTLVSLTLLAVALGPGCASEPAAPEPAPAATAKAPARKPAPQRPRGLREGQVLFSVASADLRGEVLPLFESQAGVKIIWEGPPKQVSVRLSAPLDWELAMDLVCRFTRTHLTKDYRGRYVLKEGWGGDLGGGETLTGVRRSGAAPAAGGGASRAGGGASGGGASGGATSSETYDGSYGTGGNPDAYSGGQTARDLLKGTTTRSSGGR